MQEAKQRCADLLDGLRTQVLTRLAPELIRFTLAWADERRRAGRLHFHDLLVLARNLLWNDTAVRRALAQRWSVLVIDEFQDTDPLQVELVFALAAADPTRLPGTVGGHRAGRRAGCSSSATPSSRSTASAAPTSRCGTAPATSSATASCVSRQNFRSVDAILEWVNAGVPAPDRRGRRRRPAVLRRPVLAPNEPRRRARPCSSSAAGPTDRAAVVRVREAERDRARPSPRCERRATTVADDAPGAVPGGCRPCGTTTSPSSCPPVRRSARSSGPSTTRHPVPDREPLAGVAHRRRARGARHPHRRSRTRPTRSPWWPPCARPPSPAPTPTCSSGASPTDGGTTPAPRRRPCRSGIPCAWRWPPCGVGTTSGTGAPSTRVVDTVIARAAARRAHHGAAPPARPLAPAAVRGRPGPGVRRGGRRVARGVPGLGHAAGRRGCGSGRDRRARARRRRRPHPHRPRRQGPRVPGRGPRRAWPTGGPPRSPTWPGPPPAPS